MRIASGDFAGRRDASDGGRVRLIGPRRSLARPLNALASRPSRAAEPLLLVVAALGVVIVCFNRALLPAYYFNDDNTMRSYMDSDPQIVKNNSFQTAATIYNSIGLQDSSTVVGLIAFGLLLAGVALARRATASRPLSLMDAIVFAFVILMGAVYLGQLSKEPFVLLVVLAFLLLARRLAGELIWLALFVVPLAIYIRPYWTLVAAIYFVFRFLFQKSKGMGRLILIPILCLLVIALYAHEVQGKSSVVAFRTDVQSTLYNVYGTANSTVRDYLTTTGLGFGWADAVLSFALLIVPIPLFLLGGAQYLFIGAVIAGLWYRFYAVVRSYSTRFADMPPLALKCVYLTLSFVSVQSIFEPDYGSYLRHLTDLMPVFLVVVATGRRAGGEAAGTTEVGETRHEQCDGLASTAEPVAIE